MVTGVCLAFSKTLVSQSKMLWPPELGKAWQIVLYIVQEERFSCRIFTLKMQHFTQLDGSVPSRTQTKWFWPCASKLKAKRDGEELVPSLTWAAVAAAGLTDFRIPWNGSVSNCCAPGPKPRNIMSHFNNGTWTLLFCGKCSFCMILFYRKAFFTGVDQHASLLSGEE